MWFQQHFSHVDHFTCPSRFMIEHYVDWGLPRQKMTQVANGQQSYVPPNWKAQRRGPANRFGFFGQLHQSKGAHVLLRAIDLLRRDGFTDFHVELNAANPRFASPEMRAELHAALQTERDFPPRERIVTDNGPYEIDRLHNRMNRIDWSIVPSVWWESFGLVISEAWMFGKPVICSNVGGMAERVRDEIDGLHFEIGSPRALADVIRRACTEEGLWEQLHSALPIPPSREAMADMYLRLYRGTLSDKRKRD